MNSWTVNFLFLSLVWVVPAQALDIYGRSANDCQSVGGVTRCGHGPAATDPSIQALYMFDDVGTDAGTGRPMIQDLSGKGNHLLIYNGAFGSTDAAAVRKGIEFLEDPVTGQFDAQARYIDIRKPALLRTKNAFNVDQCKASRQITIEAWLRNDREDQQIFQLTEAPIKIVTMSGASNNNNFYLGYNYINAAEFNAGIRLGARRTTNRDVRNLANDTSDDYPEETSNVVLSTNDTPDNKILQKDKIQHVIFTQEYNSNDRTGVSRLYVSTASTNPTVWTPMERAMPVVTNNANFDSWGNFYLSVGNEVTAFNDNSYPKIRDTGAETTEDRDWRGQIFLLAIYCRALDKDEILGAASGNDKYKNYPSNVNAMISPAHLQALQLYRRLVGVGIPISAHIIGGDPNVPDDQEEFMAKHIQNYIDKTDSTGLFKAAELATSEDNFYNITVRDMAKRMSVRNETVQTPFNDMVAFFMGITRDGADARDLLKGNYYYAGDPQLAAVPDNIVNDILVSNNHYQSLEDQGYNLVRVLKKYSPQKIFDGNSVKTHPDAAGVLTSRAFMAAHAVAGTNRRVVEFAFREFMCLPMEQWANASGPDQEIGADVSRFPGGDHSKFLQQCRGCHSNMDGLRGAFAKFNFANGFVKYADHFTGRSPANENGEDASSMYQDPPGIAGKMNRNPNFYPCPTQQNRNQMCRVGKEVTTDEWVNFANLGLNANRFGWRGAMSGRGARDLGSMVANSQQFSRCMTQRVFRAVCKREPEASDQSAIQTIATEFEQSNGLNYSLRKLFARVAIARECSGD